MDGKNASKQFLQITTETKEIGVFGKMEQRYYQKEIETMDRKDLVKFQLERLKQTIELAGNSPFYHKIFKEKGITPDRNAYVSTLPAERQVIPPLSYIPPRIWINGLTK